MFNLVLIQIAEAETLSVLLALRSRVPDEVQSRTRILASRPSDISGLPRAVAALEKATDAEMEAIRQALSDVGSDAFELTLGGMSTSMKPEPDNAFDPDEIVAAMDWLPSITKPSLGGIEEDLERILKADESGIPFPETLYDGDLVKAYDSICKQLGREPLVDRGETLKLADFQSVKRPRRPRINVEAWNQVLDHLKTEVRYFGLAREWFATNGIVPVSLDRNVFFDREFVERLNTEYGIVKDQGTKVSILMDVAMAVALKIIGGASGQVAFLLGQIWNLAKNAGESSGGKITAAIRDIRKGVVQQYSDSLSAVGNCLEVMLSDWGNLKAFGDMVMDGSLSWPVNDTDLRCAHAIGFHTECLRVLLSKKSALETHKDHYYRCTWGVIRSQLHGSKPVKRHFDMKRGALCLSSGKPDHGTYSHTEFMLGFMGENYIEEWGWQGPPPKPIARSLIDKMYGTDQTNPVDPQLKIPANFLEHEKHRKGWALKTAWYTSY